MNEGVVIFGMVPRQLITDRKIGHAAKTLYAALATYANADGECWPSHETLCNDLGIKDSRTLRVGLKELEEGGYIVRAARRSKDGMQIGNFYKLCFKAGRSEHKAGELFSSPRADKFCSHGDKKSPAGADKECPPQGDRESPPEQTTGKNIPKTPPLIPKEGKGQEPEGFGEWYSRYPVKVARPAAARAYRRARKLVPRAMLLDALDRHVANWRENETERHLIPHPATWLNQHRWEDELIRRKAPPPPLRDYRERVPDIPG